MLSTETVIFISLCYIGLLFGIAHYGDKCADAGRSIIANPLTYALSLAVYCTAWTFYGSVGRAASAGPGFLTIYIGPTLTASLGWLILKKIIRISKIHRITSIADFIASRYGKSMVLGGFVTIIAVLGIIPYISLQLKAISTSFHLIRQYPLISPQINPGEIIFFQDTTFYVALILAVFAILFGTRHLEATERHEGLVAAIAFESLVKLIAFFAVGIFVIFFVFNGFEDMSLKAQANDHIKRIFLLDPSKGDFLNWVVYIFLSMMAVLFLPRQFQVAVVENVNEKHLNRAMWLFPLYLLAINIFVMPVAIAGLYQFKGMGIDADTFVLTVPMAAQQPFLVLLVFIGGVSAATGMVIVETVALSIMISNDLVMPILLHIKSFNLAQRSDLSNILVSIRRGSILIVLMLGYTYFHFTAGFYTLVSIGLVSFAAVAQFAPAVLFGIFWKGGTKKGALCGLAAGFLIWFYTLFLPSLAGAGLISHQFLDHGPFGIALLKPFHLFGLEGFDSISHSIFWSMIANIGAYMAVSMYTRQSAIEHTQAAMFVDVFQYSGKIQDPSIWRGTAYVPDLVSMLERFMGKERTKKALLEYEKTHDTDRDGPLTTDPWLVNHVEKLLAGAIGSASARVMVASVVKEEPLGIEEVLRILDETRYAIFHSKELEKATAELKAANERLKELDRLKDEFISTVSHELRTPLTSIQSLAEILHDYPETEIPKQKEFAKIIVRESRRLTRLIVQVLDFQKMESDRMKWNITNVSMIDVLNDAVAATRQLVTNKNLQLDLVLPDMVGQVSGDRDQLIQAMVNLVSNAVKFCEPDTGVIKIVLSEEPDLLRIKVQDNGIGISRKNQRAIFNKFHQVVTPSMGRPSGTGLGLSITKRIIDFHSGTISVRSSIGRGSIFSFTLPKQTINASSPTLG